jgi:AAA family ATP:ADP antiporter
MAAGSKNPLAVLLALRREELPLTLLMFGQFFSIITTFWILKPLKKAQFFEFYTNRSLDVLGFSLSAAQAELLAKVLNLVVAYVAVVVFSTLAQRLRRAQLTLAFSAFFVVMLIGYALTSTNLGGTQAWSFYLFGDLYSSLMVATFFAFLNDSVSPVDARRLYGPIVLGGVAGGAFGTSVLATWIKHVELSTWLWICVGIAFLIAAMAVMAGRIVARQPQPSLSVDSSERTAEQESSAPARSPNPALEGARLVLKSRYLLALVVMVGLYEIVSTVLDFQFSATVEHYAKLGLVDKTQHFATTYAITNWLALAVQVGLTSFLMSRFRLTVSLAVLPVMVVVASSTFLFLPLVWVASALSTTDNALSYSINQSAREALYTVTSPGEKYNAKAFIDVFVQRFAKALAVLGSLTFTLWLTDFSSLRYLTLFTLLMIAGWMVAARYAGKTFERLAAENNATPADQPKAQNVAHS